MRAIGCVLVALATASCAAGAKSPATTGAGGSGSYGRCSIDTNCGGGACVQGTCLPRPGAPSRPWAIEIRPSSNSTNAALTEIVQAPTDTIWHLSADAYVDASATFVTSSNGTAGTTGSGGSGGSGGTTGNAPTLPGNANVVLSLPSRISGRPALTFESTFPSGGMTAMLRIPAGTRSRAGTLSLVPLAPADQSNPPYRFAATVPESGSTLTDGAGMTGFKVPSSNLVQGVLRNAFSEPKAAYTARAYLDGTLVSNANVTQMDGKFQLSVPSSLTGEIVVELAPPSAADPWFIYTKRTLTGASQDLGTVTLPVYQVPVTNSGAATFHVQSNEPIPSIVGNAAIRALTILSTSDVGVSRFWQNTTTDSKGNANLSLIPGMNQTPRTYEVSVVPPPGSPYASTCVERQILSPTDTSTIELSARRTLLTGVVTSALGAPLEGVTIAASRDAASARICSTSTTTGPTTFTTSTGRDGSYLLYVDAGTYQIDYDPPAGSSAPRLTKPEVVATDGVQTVQLSVQLHLGALVEGDVVGPGNMPLPLPNATIRIFEPCTATGCMDPPALVAETQTDVQGHFRVVVALPGTN